MTETTGEAAGAPGPDVLDVDVEGGPRLVGSRCRGCAASYFPRRRTCARCLSEDLERVRLSPQGTVYTFTAVHQSTPAFPVPYVLAYVDLPEGVRVPAQISGCGPDEVRIGMPVTIAAGGDDPPAYRFHPSGGDR